MSEVGMRGAGGEHKVVVGFAGSRIENNLTLFDVDAGYFVHQDFGVGLAAQDGANRLSDARRREDGERDLVKKWLKGMVVATVDNGYVDWCFGQRFCGMYATKSCADNHDMGSVWRGSRLNLGRERFCQFTHRASLCLSDARGVIQVAEVGIRRDRHVFPAVGVGIFPAICKVWSSFAGEISEELTGSIPDDPIVTGFGLNRLPKFTMTLPSPLECSSNPENLAFRAVLGGHPSAHDCD